ncbi:MAG: stage V sporulation protein S [Thermomicrobiales bacterium]|nr:stage V sporulation protein S [Thermomicrobiales bacterium]
MDRFFSKLDLRDIKIKPEGSRFLPDDDEVEVLDEPSVASVTYEEETVELAEETDAEPNDSVFENNGHIVSTTYERIEVTEWSTPAGIADAPIDAVPLDEGDTEVLKVSAKSRPSAVAGAIAGVVRENGRAEVQAIGAGATNQAIKAIAIAREYLLETDIDAICVPAFIDVTIDNEERTAIRLVIERR